MCHTGSRAAQGKRDLPSRADYYAQWRLSEPEKAHAIRLRSVAKRMGLDPDAILRSWREHNGLCDMCGDPPTTNTRLCLDHDHATGAFRGWLCSNCNFMLGHAKDDPDRLLAGVAYLRRS